MKLRPLDIPLKLHVHRDRRVSNPRATIVLLHGIGNTGAYWQTLEDCMPEDVRIISIDLLGFGNSPKPKNATYNVRVQARSVAMTLLTMRTGRIYIVGHSMGSLIAIELAKRYPLLVRGLLLCSPPIYRTRSERQKTFLNIEAILTDLYAKFGNDALAKPERYIALAKVASAAKIAPSTFYVTHETLKPYISALNASIIDQSSYQDIKHITVPIHIIYGKFDPFIVTKNLKTLAQVNSRIQLHSVFSGHEASRAYKKPIISSLHKLLSKTP